jgi:hypothetical protein
MNILIDGVAFHKWIYTLPQWWRLSHHERIQRIPLDGSAHLMSGPREVVDHLRDTGRLATNMVSDIHVTCDLPVTGLCFAALS